jgi:hypothetical protein
MGEWIFLTSALVGGEWSASGLGHYTCGTHWIGGWVGPRADLDAVEKRKILSLPGIEIQPLGHPVIAARACEVWKEIPRHWLQLHWKSGSLTHRN